MPAKTAARYTSPLAALIPNCAVTLNMTGSEVGQLIDGLDRLIDLDPETAMRTGLADLKNDLLDWYLAH